MRIWMILLTILFVFEGLCVLIGIMLYRAKDLDAECEAAERAERQQKFLDYLKDTDDA